MRIIDFVTPRTIDVRGQLLKSWTAHGTEIFEKRWNLA